MSNTVIGLIVQNTVIKKLYHTIHYYINLIVDKIKVVTLLMETKKARYHHLGFFFSFFLIQS